MKPNWQDSLLRPDTPIIEAIKAIDVSELQIALIVDGDSRLTGTLTDGDVRRGLLRGVGLEQPVHEIMERRPHHVRLEADRAERLQTMRLGGFRHLPLVDGDGRVVGLETLEELQQPEPRHEWVVIMAGGLGTRLRPLTETKPKPMLDIGGRPILETSVRRFAKQGFRRIFLAVRYLAQQIEDHFGDGSDLGVEIAYLHEERAMGTAGALSLLPELPDRPVVVTNGDIDTLIDAQRLLAFHDKCGAAATLCAREYVTQIPFGVIDATPGSEPGGRRLIAIDEKPIQRFLINAGIYVLDPAAIALLRPQEPANMPDLLIRAKEAVGAVMVYPILDYWRDIGGIAEVDRARDDFAGLYAANTAPPSNKDKHVCTPTHGTLRSTRRSTGRG
jgi:dTDP-glucose pyrophosphorylase